MVLITNVGLSVFALGERDVMGNRASYKSQPLRPRTFPVSAHLFALLRESFTCSFWICSFVLLLPETAVLDHAYLLMPGNGHLIPDSG